MASLCSRPAAGCTVSCAAPSIMPVRQLVYVPIRMPARKGTLSRRGVRGCSDNRPSHGIPDYLYAHSSQNNSQWRADVQARTLMRGSAACGGVAGWWRVMARWLVRGRASPSGSRGCGGAGACRCGGRPARKASVIQGKTRGWTVNSAAPCQRSCADLATANWCRRFPAGCAGGGTGIRVPCAPLAGRFPDPVPDPFVVVSRNDPLCGGEGAGHGDNTPSHGLQD